MAEVSCLCTVTGGAGGLVGEGVLSASAQLDHASASISNKITCEGQLKACISSDFNASVGGSSGPGFTGVGFLTGRLNGVFSVSGLDMSGVGDLSSNLSVLFNIANQFEGESAITAEMPDKFHGDFELLCGQKMYPTEDVTNNSFIAKLPTSDFETSGVYRAIDEGAVLYGYHKDKVSGEYLVSDDHASLITPSGTSPKLIYEYKAKLSKFLINPKDSRFVIRASGPLTDHVSELPPKYTFYDIKLEDPSGNLVVQYDDISFRGDGSDKYGTYSSSGIIINRRTVDTGIPFINSEDPATVSFKIKTTCLDSAFTEGYDDGYDDVCNLPSTVADDDDYLALEGAPISVQQQSLGRNPSVNISALEICNSGNVLDIFNNVPLYIDVHTTGIQEDVCFKPTEFFNHSFDTTVWPANNSEWSNEDGLTNRTTSSLTSLLQSVKNASDADYVSLDHTTINDSGKLVLKFAHEKRDSYYKIQEGAFDTQFAELEYPINRPYLFTPPDPFFVVNSGDISLKIRAKKSAGSRDFSVDVVGYSNDRIFAVTPPSGGFLQNIEGSGNIPTKKITIGSDYQAMSAPPVSSMEETRIVSTALEGGGDHYLLATSPVISGVGFQDYEVPLALPPSLAGGGKFASSSYFEHLILDMYPFPSGAAVSSIELCVKRPPTNAVTLHVVGKVGKYSEGRSETKIYPAARQSGDAIFNTGPDECPISKIESIPHGYNTPADAKSNYARRWKGYTGLVNGPFDVDEFNFEFHNPIIPNNFDLGFYNFEKDVGTSIKPYYSDDTIGTLVYSGNDPHYKTLGWRFTDESIFSDRLPSYTSAYKTTDWTSLSYGGNDFTGDPLYGKIADAFDTVVRLGSGNYISYGDIPTGSGFSMYVRFSPDYPASGVFSSGVIVSKYDSDPMQFVLGYADGKLCLTASDDTGAIHQIKDTLDFHEYQYPLSAMVVYDDSDKKFRLYTDNEISAGVFTTLRGTSSAFDRSQAGTHNLTLGYSAGSGIDSHIFVDEFGIGAKVINSDAARDFLETRRMKLWNQTDTYEDDTFKMWSYINQDSRSITGGAFSTCMFSNAFDKIDKSIGNDYIRFEIDHHGSGYPEIVTESLPSNVPGAAYHTQIENDFMRFNLTDLPSSFYAVAPRIVKKFPRGYEFYKGAITTELWIEHSSESTFTWDDGTEGARFIVSLYTNKQHNEAKENYGLVTRKVFHLGSGCLQRIDATFDYDDFFDTTEAWATYPEERTWTELEHKYFKEDIDQMFMQLDIAYPSGQAFHSVLDVYTAHTRLDGSFGYPVNLTDSFNLYSSGDIALIGSGFQDLSVLGGIYLNNNMELAFSGAHIQIDNSPLGLPLFMGGMDLYSSGIDLSIATTHIQRTSNLNLNLPFVYNPSVTDGDGNADPSNPDYGVGGGRGASIPLVLPNVYMVGTGTVNSSTNLFLDVASLSTNSVNLFIPANYSSGWFSLFLFNDQPRLVSDSSLNLSMYSTENSGIRTTMPLFAKAQTPNIIPRSGWLDLSITGRTTPVGPFEVNNNFNLMINSDDATKIYWNAMNLVLGTGSIKTMSSYGDYVLVTDINEDGTISENYSGLNLYPSGLNFFLKTIESNGDCQLRWNTNNLGEFISNRNMCHGIDGCESPAQFSHGIPWIPASTHDGGILRLGTVEGGGDGYGLKRFTGLIPTTAYDIVIKGTTSDIKSVELPQVWERWQSGIKLVADQIPSGVLAELPQSGLYLPNLSRIAGDEFGYSVDLYNDTMIVGAPKHPYNEFGANYLEDAGAAFVYRRVVPSNDIYGVFNVGDWFLEQKLTCPSRFYTDSSGIRMPSGWLNADETINYRSIGSHRRQFGTSVAIKGDQIVVGAPQAVDPPPSSTVEVVVPPSALYAAAMVFVNEAVSIYHPWDTQEGYKTAWNNDIDSWYYLSINKNAEYTKNLPLRDLNTKLLLYQPDPNLLFQDYATNIGNTLKPNGHAFPSFVRHTTTGRKNYGEWDTPSGYIFEQIRDHFLASTSGEIPVVVGIHVDRSDSLSRTDLEPAIDEFINWYKNYTFQSGVVDVYGINASGFLLEQEASSFTNQERWVRNASISLGRALSHPSASGLIASGIGVVSDAPYQNYHYPVPSGGKAYVFNRVSGVWVFKQELESLNTSSNEVPDLFGISVGMSTDSGNIFVGARDKSGKGSVYAFELKPSEYTSHIPFFMNPDVSASGLASLFDRFYDRTQVLVSNDIRTNDMFGHSLAYAQGDLIVGAPHQDYDSNNTNQQTNAGAAYIFNVPVRYPHSGVIEYYRFGNTQRTSRNSAYPSEFDDLEFIFESGGYGARSSENIGYFKRTIPQKAEIDLGVGLSFILNPEISTYDTEDLKQWLSYGNRRLVITGETSDQVSSNLSVNRLLTKLESTMRLSDIDSVNDSCVTNHNAVPVNLNHSTMAGISRLWTRGVNDISIGDGQALAKELSIRDSYWIVDPAGSGYNYSPVYYTVGTSGWIFGTPFAESEFVWNSGSNPGTQVLSPNPYQNFEKPSDGILKVKDTVYSSTSSYTFPVVVEPSSVVASYEIYYSGGSVSPVTSEIILIAGTESEETEYMFNDINDDNLLFYTHLYPECNPASGHLVQVGGWTGNVDLKTSSFNKRSILKGVYNSAGVTVTENHSGPLPADAKVAWIPTPSGTPNSSGLADITNWLDLGDKRLVITYDKVGVVGATNILSLLGSTMKPYYISSKGEYASNYPDEALQLNTDATEKHKIFDACAGEYGTIGMFSHGTLTPISVGSGSLIVSNTQDIIGLETGYQDSYQLSLPANSKEISIPGLPGSGYTMFFEWEVDNQNSDIGIHISTPNNSIIPSDPSSRSSGKLKHLPGQNCGMSLGRKITSHQLIANDAGVLDFIFDGSMNNLSSNGECVSRFGTSGVPLLSSYPTTSIKIISASGHLTPIDLTTGTVPVLSGYIQTPWYIPESSGLIPESTYLPADAPTIVAAEQYQGTTSEIVLISDSNMLQERCESYRDMSHNRQFIKNLYPVSPVAVNSITQDVKLTPSDRHGVEDYQASGSVTTPGDNFGRSVGIHKNINLRKSITRTVIGSPYHGYNEDETVLTVASGGGHGAAYVFERVADLISTPDGLVLPPAASWNQSQKLVASGLRAGNDNISDQSVASGILGEHHYSSQELLDWLPEPDRFGWSVDVNNDIIIASAPGHDFGVTDVVKSGGEFSRAFNFEFSKPVIERSPSGIAVLNAGAVYNYVLTPYTPASSSGIWVNAEKLIPEGHNGRVQRHEAFGASGTENDHFGISISLDNKARADSNYIVAIGGHNHDYSTSGDFKTLEAGASWVHDGVVVPQPPASSNFNYMGPVSIYGDPTTKIAITIDQASGYGVEVTHSGRIWSNSDGEIFLESSGFDGAGGVGLVQSHVVLNSIEGQCIYGNIVTSNLDLFVKSPESIDPTDPTDLIDTSGTSTADHTRLYGLNLYMGGMGPSPINKDLPLVLISQGYTSNINLTVAGVSGVSTSSINLVLPSSVAPSTSTLNLYSRGK